MSVDTKVLLSSYLLYFLKSVASKFVMVVKLMVKLNAFILLLSLLFSLCLPQIVLGGGGDTNSAGSDSEPTKNPDTSSTPSTSASSLGNVSLPNGPQHYDSYNSNYNSYGSLNPPYCGGSCAFAVTKLTPNANGNTNLEAVMGVIFEFDSANKRAASAYQAYYDALSRHTAQEDDVSIAMKLADAVSNCREAHAQALALLVARRLGITPEELLSRLKKQQRNCNSFSNTVK